MKPALQEQSRYASFLELVYNEIAYACTMLLNNQTPEGITLFKEGVSFTEDLKTIATQGTALRNVQIARVQSTYELFRVKYEKTIAAG